jgi:hypothetical protein
MFESMDISANKATPNTVNSELAKIKMLSCLTLQMAITMMQKTKKRMRFNNFKTSFLSAFLK